MQVSEESNSQLQKWIFISMALALIGVCFSVYLTMHYFEVLNAGSTDAFCNINDKFSCDDVARSPYSTFLNIPLGVWGTGFFLAQMVVLFLAMFKPETSSEHIFGQVGMTVVGAITSLVLLVISGTMIGKYCINCIGVYLVCFAQVGVLIAFRQSFPTDFSVKRLMNGATSAALVVAVVAGLFQFTKDSWISKKPSAQLNSTTGQPRDEQALDLSPNAVDVKIDKSPYSGMGEDFRKGNDDSRVVIVEFADFQCPACRSAWDLMKQVQKQYSDQVLIVYKNYPLDKTCNSSVQQQIHQYACEAAVMARCAGAQGKFWDLANKMYENQSSMNSENIGAWSLSVGLSPQQIATCKASKDILAKIADDVKLGNQLNVNSTPTIFINGRQILGGRSVETIQGEIERILGR